MEKTTNIDGQQYSEIELEKIVVDDKEQQGLVLTPEQTKGKSTINVTLFAKDNTNPSKSS